MLAHKIEVLEKMYDDVIEVRGEIGAGSTNYSSGEFDEWATQYLFKEKGIYNTEYDCLAEHFYELSNILGETLENNEQ